MFVLELFFVCVVVVIVIVVIIFFIFFIVFIVFIVVVVLFHFILDHSIMIKIIYFSFILNIFHLFY